MSNKPCGKPILSGAGKRVPDVYGDHRCGYDRMYNRQQCLWHWLMKQPADVQSSYADKRLAERTASSSDFRARVPEVEWPDGERWCAGCQSYIPKFYVSGSRCKACASRAAHASRVESLYGLPKGDYERLFEFQGGVCYICRRTPRKIRLAVDHDHATGKPRGLLCANNENGCNRAVVANLENAPDGGGLAAAKRLVEYFAMPPYEQFLLGRGPGSAELQLAVIEQSQKPEREKPEPLPPPF